RLAEIRERENRNAQGPGVANLREQEFALRPEARAAGVMKALEVGREHASRVGCWIEPTDSSGPDSAVAPSAEAVDEGVSLELEPGRREAAVASARHPEDLRVLGIDIGLRSRGVAGRKAHEERGVRAVGEVRWRIRTDERADRLQVRRGRFGERIVA